jgi:hypothetical protein
VNTVRAKSHTRCEKNCYANCAIDLHFQQFVCISRKIEVYCRRFLFTSWLQKLFACWLKSFNNRF